MNLKLPDQGDTGGHAVSSGQSLVGRWRCSGGTAGVAAPGQSSDGGLCWHVRSFLLCRLIRTLASLKGVLLVWLLTSSVARLGKSKCLPHFLPSHSELPMSDETQQLGGKFDLLARCQSTRRTFLSGFRQLESISLLFWRLKYLAGQFEKKNWFS